MKIDIIQYISSRTPRTFFTLANELLEAAYFQAHQHAMTFDDPEKRRVLGQLRHYRQNEALRNAGAQNGLIAVAAHTAPKGERYSLIASEDIRFGRIGVPVNNSTPRPSKHRKELSMLNARLEPVNLDLFNQKLLRPSDGLGCLIITVNPNPKDQQTAPADIKVGVPYTNMRGWHLFEPMSEIIAAYNPAVEIEVQDLAWVKLKKQLGDSEN
ncbi:hypothetical protein [Undibacterium sp.]|uniref:hypothetical protein n=1 Tax=Undibacterium sp. TaxID=1914977 RepID=UPI0037537273